MDLHRTYTARKRRCLCLVLLAAGLLAGCNETGQPEETETTVQEIVLAEETQPMTAPDERVLALTPDGPILPSVEGVQAEYTDPIPDYLRIGMSHPVVAKLQQRLMDLGED